MSLAFALPVAVFDLARIDQFLEVRHAQGNETYLAWSDETEGIPEGIVQIETTLHNIVVRSGVATAISCAPRS